MPRFHFHLRADVTIHRDLEGSECSDHATARSHAIDVAVELMRNAECERRHWSICVADADGQALFDIFFADVDATLDHLPADWRGLRTETSRNYAGLVDALCAARATRTESRMLIAQARRRPQLVYSRNGEGAD